jgi:hypothetical protein
MVWCGVSLGCSKLTLQVAVFMCIVHPSVAVLVGQMRVFFLFERTVMHCVSMQSLYNDEKKKTKDSLSLNS